MVVQCFTRFRTNLGNLRISQDICYVRTDNNGFLTIYRHRASLLNNKGYYLLVVPFVVVFDYKMLIDEIGPRPYPTFWE